MLKIERFRFQYLFSAALIALFGAFLACHFFAAPRQAFADDGTPIKTAAEDYFVTIHDQDSTLVVKTKSVTVAELLSEAGVTVAETDLVEPSLSATIDGDYNINIHRARPAIVIDGLERHYLMTASYDPKQIAIEAGLTIYDGDEFSIEFNTNFLEAGAASTYRIERKGGRTITINETLPYTVETRYDFNLAKGESYLEQAGEDGRRISKYSVEFVDNQEASRTLISEEVILEPVTEIVVVGAKVSIPPEREECANWAREAGVSELELEAAIDLIYRESGCRVDATNPSSGAYGIPQALPGAKMAELGDDWQTNPVTQIRWMAKYVTTRYGGWQQALDFWWCTGVCNGTKKSGYWY